MQQPEIYAMGLCFCSVCAPESMTAEEIVESINLTNPTGIDTSWQLGPASFKGGEPNPCVCHDNPARKHWLLEC